MIRISQNIEDRVNYYKDWYKEMDTLVGVQFNTTPEFENSLSVGHKIHIDTENPSLPNGMSIPIGATFSLDNLRTKTLVVTGIAQTGNSKTIDVGIRSTASEDY